MIPLEKVKTAIGGEAYQKLIDAFPGEHIYIKKIIDEFPDKESRNAAILDDYYSGMTRQDLAREYHLSVPSIDKITGKAAK